MRRAVTAVVLTILSLPAIAGADTGGSGGGYVRDDGTPVAEARGTSARRGSAGRSSSARCTYVRAEVGADRVYNPDGTEAVADGPGEWYVKRCFQDGMEVRGDIVFVPPADPARLAREAKRELPLTAPFVGTNPRADGYQLVAVPTWLWIEDDWETSTATAEVPGVSVTVTATPESVTWSMGNGDVVTCTGPGTPYAASKRSDEQRTNCSYTYRRSSASQPGQQYRVTATVTWTVSWSASGVAGRGSLGTVSRSTSFGLRVAEAQALNR